MVERICPACQAGNPLDDRFCGKCGAALERLLPAPRSQTTALARVTTALPVEWRQIGKTVALGAAALAVELGVAWLTKRLDGAAQAAKSPTTALTAPSGTKPATNVVTIISQRVIEFVEDGPNGPSIVEKQIWRKIEE